MMTSSNGNIFRVTGHLYGEFTGPRWIPAQRPVTQSLDVFFDLRLNERLSKQSRCWWFETLLRPLCHHCNVIVDSQNNFEGNISNFVVSAVPEERGHMPVGLMGTRISTGRVVNRQDDWTDSPTPCAQFFFKIYPRVLHAGLLCLNYHSTTICKLVDLIPALHQSDCRIPNWVSAKTVLSCSTNHGQTTARFRSFFR